MPNLAFPHVICGVVVAKMCLIVLLFVSVHFCDSVIIRIKPVRIVSYQRNHTDSVTQISATEVPVDTNPTHMKDLPYSTEDIVPSSVMPFSTKATPFTSTISTLHTDSPKESPQSSKSEVTFAEHVTTPRLADEVTASTPKLADQVTVRTPTLADQVAVTPKLADRVAVSSPKLTTASLTPIRPAKNLTDRAGLFQINPHTRLFYWFFRSKSSPSDPLVIWLQGQPNASSLYGAFDETGPYLINPQTKSLSARQHTWSNSFNILYLDPHPGCGFSYSDKSSEYLVSYEKVAKGILKAMKQFFTLYPQLATNNLYLAAQSVGAKYAIVVAHAILQSSHWYKLNLKGILLGGAVVDEYQLANYDYRLLTFGLVDMKTMDEMAYPQDYMAALIRTEAYSRAVEFWHQQIFPFFTNAGYHSPYDAREVNAFWDSPVADYINQAKIMKELKIGALKFQPAAKAYITSETLRPLQILIRELLSNIKVLLYHGQFDLFSSIAHSYEFLNKFNWPQNLDFYSSKRQNWFIGKRLCGYWSNNKNLTVLMIRNAGHMVGVTQPASMEQMLIDFVNNKFEVSYAYQFGNRDVEPPEEFVTDIGPQEVV